MKQSKQAPEQAHEQFQLPVTVEDITGKLVLRQVAGEGTIHDVPFTYDTAIPSGAFIVTILDRCYLLNPKSFIEALADKVLK